MRTTLSRSFTNKLAFPNFFGQKLANVIGGRGSDKYQSWVDDSWHHAKGRVLQKGNLKR